MKNSRNISASADKFSESTYINSYGRVETMHEYNCILNNSCEFGKSTLNSL
jgi:hypothetical protein